MATLEELITEAGLRQSELSDETGVHAATISRICHGKATTRVTVVKLVRQLEKHLNRSIDIDSIEGLNIKGKEILQETPKRQFFRPPNLED